MMHDCIQSIKLEIFQNQSEIIHKQASVIDELFLILCQHLSAEELDRLPVIDSINEIASIRKELEL